MRAISTQLAQSIMQRSPLLPELPVYHGKWTYDYGVVLKGFERLYQLTKEEKYRTFIQKNLDYFLNEEGEVRGYDEHEFNIDHINTGKSFFFLYNLTKEEKYKKALDRFYYQLLHHPRTSEGVFWHKEIYPYQIWLDGLYMGAPFYAEYARDFLSEKEIQDVFHQFRISYTHLKDKKTGLIMHAWDEKKEQFWIEKETGLSHHFWSRSIGWYLMAAVDVFELLNEQTDKQFLIEIVEDTLSALQKYQSKSGVWYQITDEQTRKGNYLESSGSSMFLYAMAKGIRLGMLSREKWLAQVEKTYHGIIDEFLLETKQGWLNVNKICEVAGLGGKEKRDGSFAYYISEPIVSNDLKGVGACLQAMIESEGLLNE